jgi:cbb3-type cytochrome oxidase maturation protein
MDVVFVLLPLALLVAGIMLGLFVWAVRSGQYDDLETPAVRILLDDEEAPPQLADDDTGDGEAAPEERSPAERGE